LREHGPDVSTRQIADAAGVAEGTIFRVFPDKATLLRATLVNAFDPAPLVEELTTIDPTLGLHQRVAAVLELLRRRLGANAGLIAVTRVMGGTDSDHQEFVERLKSSRARIMAAVADVLRPDVGQLRRDPAISARLLLMMVMATIHSHHTEPNALTEIGNDELASLLLDGLLVRHETADTQTGDDAGTYVPTGEQI
jgi:AcrR family transcriptional regulator